MRAALLALMLCEQLCVTRAIVRANRFVLCFRTDILEKLSVVAGSELASLQAELAPILEHYAARPANGLHAHLSTPVAGAMC